MYFSKPEDLTEEHISINRGRFNDDCRKTPKQDRNLIKINKSKLPSDFFKKSLQKSLPRKSSPISTSNRLSIPRTIALRKCPQTQRNINSYNQLPESTQFDFPLDLTIAKTHNLRAQVEQKKNLSHKSHLMEINTGDDEFLHINIVKDYVKPNCIKRNEVSEIKEASNQLRHIIRKRFPSKFNTQQLLGQNPSIPEQIDMTCTFGKGFKFSQNQNNTSLEFSDNKQSRQRYRGKQSSHKKLFEEKSTEQSEVHQGLKTTENSPIRTCSENKINLISQQAALFDQQKFGKIQWNMSRQELPPFQNLYLEKSKQVFTSEERERKSKYRIKNTSKDHRNKLLRNEKKLGQLNLPRISKGSNGYQDYFA